MSPHGAAMTSGREATAEAKWRLLTVSDPDHGGSVKQGEHISSSYITLQYSKMPPMAQRVQVPL